MTSRLLFFPGVETPVTPEAPDLASPLLATILEICTACPHHRETSQPEDTTDPALRHFCANVTFPEAINPVSGERMQYEGFHPQGFPLYTEEKNPLCIEILNTPDCPQTGREAPLAQKGAYDDLPFLEAARICVKCRHHRLADAVWAGDEEGETVLVDICARNAARPNESLRIGDEVEVCLEANPFGKCASFQPKLKIA